MHGGGSTVTAGVPLPPEYTQEVWCTVVARKNNMVAL
jgi:hypothetical protein